MTVKELIQLLSAEDENMMITIETESSTHNHNIVAEVQEWYTGEEYVVIRLKDHRDLEHYENPYDE